LDGPAGDCDRGAAALSGATLQNEYLRLENRILKEKVSGRIRFTDEERRSLV